MQVDYEKHFESFFNEAADAAGEIALKYFRSGIAVDDKEDRTPVTQADREIEMRLRELILKRFPDHGIIGEEYGKENESGEFVWVLDPIDGTRSFITGRPLFGTIIGLTHNGVPAVGMVDQAFTRERWFGVADKFCRYNGKPVKVAPPRKLEAARCYVYLSSRVEGKYYDGFMELGKVVNVIQYNCDCYAYALLSMGCVDVVVENGLGGIYDVAGIVPLITGAGGYASAWNGSAISLSNMDGSFVAASSKELAENAVKLVMKYP